MDINELFMSQEAESLLESGAWVGGIEEIPGVEFKVIGGTSRKFVAAINAKMGQARVKNKGRPLDNDEIGQITREAIGEVMILDWRGLTNNGEPVPFDRELAKKWAHTRIKKSFKTVADLIAEAATKLDHDAQSFVEVAVKN